MSQSTWHYINSEHKQLRVLWYYWERVQTWSVCFTQLISWPQKYENICDKCQVSMCVNVRSESLMTLWSNLRCSAALGNQRANSIITIRQSRKRKQQPKKKKSSNEGGMEREWELDEGKRSTCLEIWSSKSNQEERVNMEMKFHADKSNKETDFNTLLEITCFNLYSKHKPN